MLLVVRPRSLCLALLLVTALPAEETESGADVAELLRKARTGDVAAQLEVTEHFLINALADTEGAPARDFKQVEKWLEAAALKGSAPAARMLGELLISDYPGVPVNPARAFAALEKAALGGDIRAMITTASLLSGGAVGRSPDFAKAEEWLQKAFAAAPEGSPERDQASGALQQLADWREAEAERAVLAQQAESTDSETRFQLGQRLLDEAGGDKDQQAAAVAHLRFAAEAGHVAAQNAYGLYLERSDRAAGFAWRLKAAEAGLASAQSYAALVLLRGSGPIAADPARGLDLAMRAQVQGDPMVSKTLNSPGYFPGLSAGEAQNLAFSPTPADRTRLLEAAARGETEAQHWLARGPKPETGAVTRWLAAAAKQEHPSAQFSLGLAYFNGNEVPRNRTQATAWRSRAALLGYPEAQMSLAQNLLEGSGVPANPALARYWFEHVAASPAFIEGHRQFAREKAAAITVAALPPAAALEQTKNLALTARLPDATEMIAATASQAAPTRSPGELRAAADKGDANAMYELGLADLESRRIWSDKLNGVIPVDRQRDAMDFRWIMAAARAGHPEAQFLAATDWLSGETDAGKKAWLEKAAAQGHVAAKQRLDADSKAAAVAATRAAEAAKKAAADRELAAKGDADAAFRLLRSRIKEIANAIITDFQAQQKGQPTSGQNYNLGYLDAEMIQWGDLITNRLHPDGLMMLHEYLRDDRPAIAYRNLLLRARIAKIDPRLQLPEEGFGLSSRAGLEKARAYLVGKLPADLRNRTETTTAEALRGPWVDNVFGANFESGVCGYPQDYSRAVAHYRAAAEAGHAAGQSNLARCYQLGLGVPQDTVQARDWYAKAAAQGDATARAQLDHLQPGAGGQLASAPAYDPIKDNPILQQAALATKALQGDQAAAAALDAQQQQNNRQRDLVNGAPLVRAAAPSMGNSPPAFRINEVTQQPPKAVANNTSKTSVAQPLDELGLLRSKAQNLQGKTVYVHGGLYHVPAVKLATLDDEMALPAIVARFSYSVSRGGNVFGTRIHDSQTKTIKVRDLIRQIENVSGAYIVTEIGACPSCLGQGSSWDNGSRTRTGCSKCNASGCVPTYILNNGASRAF